MGDSMGWKSKLSHDSLPPKFLPNPHCWVINKYVSLSHPNPPTNPRRCRILPRTPRRRPSPEPRSLRQHLRIRNRPAPHPLYWLANQLHRLRRLPKLRTDRHRQLHPTIRPQGFPQRSTPSHVRPPQPPPLRRRPPTSPSRIRTRSPKSRATPTLRSQHQPTRLPPLPIRRFPPIRPR